MTHQPCTCLAEFNAMLNEHNTEIDVTFSLPRDGGPMSMRPKIATSKIESRKRVGPAIAAPSFCPFCGKSYQPQPAKPDVSEQKGLMADLVEALECARHVLHHLPYRSTDAVKEVERLDALIAQVRQREIPAPTLQEPVRPVTRQEALDFLGNACRNWSHIAPVSEDDVQDVAGALMSFLSTRARNVDGAA